MTIRYVDLENGNDTTGTGSYSAPYKTLSKVMDYTVNSDEIRIAKNATADTTITSTITWTRNGTTVTMTGDHTATMVANSIIGKPTAAGNGSHETFYHVASSSYSAGTGLTTITLTHRYLGTSGTTASLIKKAIATDTGSDTAYPSTATISLYRAGYRTGVKISGGWNLSTQIRDGETWAQGKYANLSTGWVFIYSPGAGCTGITIEYLNIVNAQSSIYNLASSATNTIQYVTCIGGNWGWSNNILNLETSNHCVYFSTASGTQLQTTAGGVNRTYNYVMMQSNGDHWFDYPATGMFTFNNCIISSSSNCIYTYSTNKSYYFNNTVIMGVRPTSTTGSTGIYSQLTQAIIKFTGDSWIENCNYGIYVDSVANSAPLIDNPYIKNSYIGIYTVGQKWATVVYSYKADNVSYCINGGDQYGRLYLEGFYWTNIGTYGISMSNNSYVPFLLDGYTDTASKNKLVYNNLSSTIVPRYVSSTVNGTTGIYHGTYRLKFYDNVYMVTPPAYWFSTDSTLTTNYSWFNIFSIPVITGEKKRISVFLKTGGPSWSGTVKFRLSMNRITLSETTYTSLPDYWTKYDFDMPSAATINSELVLFVNINQNIVDLFFDDFTSTNI